MTVVLSLKAKQSIDAWLLKYPAEQKQSCLIHALKVVQEENSGWLTEGLIEAVAAYLGIPKIAAYEVATFYSLFELRPIGKHKISICTNISCLLCEGDKVANHLKKRLNIEFGETTTDGRFTLKEVECLAACGGSPAMQIGQTYYENLTPERIDAILDGLA
jgi:NADH-quinone oxidoreductase subunit E